MKRNTAVLLLAASLCAFALLAAVYVAESQNAGNPEKIFSVREAAEVFEHRNMINLDLVIISEIKEEDAAYLPPNVRVQEDFYPIGESDIVLIDGSWVRSMDKEYLYSNVDRLILGSHPVIVVNSGPEIFMDREMIVCSMSWDLGDVDLRCLFYNPEKKFSHSHNITGRSMSESLDVSYTWAKEVSYEYLEISPPDTVAIVKAMRPFFPV